MAQTIGTQVFEAVAVALVFVSALCAGQPAPPAWDTARLDLRVWVAVVPDVGFTPQWQAGLERQLGTRLARFCGAAAQVKVEQPPDGLRRSMLAGLERLGPKAVWPRQRVADKLLLVRIEALADAYQVSAREFDVTTQSFGPVVRRAVWQWSEVWTAACESAEQSFRPLGRLEAAAVRRLVLLGQGDVELSREMREELVARLRAWAHRRTEPGAELRVSAAGVDVQRIQVGTQRVDGLPAEAGQFDEVLVVAIASEKGKLTAEVRAYTQWPAGVKTFPLCQVPQLGALADALGPGLDRAWEELDKQARLRWVLRLFGGANRRGSPALGEIGPGSLFQPVVRNATGAHAVDLDKAGSAANAGDKAGSGEAGSAIPVPWTYLVVQQPSELDRLRGEWPCRVESGLKASLPVAAGPDVEVLALAVKPAGASTRLVLRTAGPSAQPLAGMEVFVAEGGSAGPLLLGCTDRTGALRVPRAAEANALRILLVGDREGFLARLPVAPGWQYELVATLPVEPGQLLVEALLAGLRNEVIEAATRREVLLTRAELYLADGQAAEAEQMLQQIRKLPTPEQMLRRLVEYQSQSTPADQNARSRLEAQVSETKKLIEGALDPKPVDQLAETLKSG